MSSRGAARMCSLGRVHYALKFIALNTARARRCVCVCIDEFDAGVFYGN